MQYRLALLLCLGVIVTGYNPGFLWHEGYRESLLHVISYPDLDNTDGTPGGSDMRKDPLRVEGTVLDHEGNPIEGARITVIRDGTPVSDPDWSDANGAYGLSYTTGTSIDVRYDRTSYHLSILHLLGGATDHRISKVLLEESATANLSLRELDRLLNNYEFVAGLEGGTQMGHENFVNFGYSRKLQRIEERLINLQDLSGLVAAEMGYAEVGQPYNKFESRFARIDVIRARYSDSSRE